MPDHRRDDRRGSNPPNSRRSSKQVPTAVRTSRQSASNDCAGRTTTVYRYEPGPQGWHEREVSGTEVGSTRVLAYPPVTGRATPAQEDHRVSSGRPSTRKKSAPQSRQMPSGRSASAPKPSTTQRSRSAPFDPNARPTFCNRNPTESTDSFLNNANFHVKWPKQDQEHTTGVVKDSYHWRSDTLFHKAYPEISYTPTGKESIWRIEWKSDGNRMISVPTCYGWMNGDKCPPNLSIKAMPEYPIIYGLCSKMDDRLLKRTVLAQTELEALVDMVDEATHETEREYHLRRGYVQVQNVVDACDLDGPEVWNKSAWLLMRPVRIVPGDV